jgi:hypothetical protein
MRIPPRQAVILESKGEFSCVRSRDSNHSPRGIERRSLPARIKFLVIRRIQLKIVDLPQPDGPRMLTNLLFGILIVTSSSAVTESPPAL